MVPNFLGDGHWNKQSTIRNQLLNISGVNGVSFATLPNGSTRNWMSFGSIVSAHQPLSSRVNFNAIVSDEYFFDLYQFNFVSGRPFSADYANDKFLFSKQKEKPFAVILNETAARVLGWDQPALATGNALRLQEKYNADIVGVVSDHHVFSLKETIPPLMYVTIKYWSHNVATIQYDMDAEPASIVAATKKIWQQYHPMRPMDYSFLEDDIAAQYDADRKQATTLATFSILAILIAGLGLFGLIAFAVNRRSLEICLRKLYGAHGIDVITLLLWHFSKPVLISSVFAWPIAYYFMTDYLSGYSYHMDLLLTHFLLASLIVLFTAWLAVFSQTVRVMRLRPIAVLRHE